MIRAFVPLLLAISVLPACVDELDESSTPQAVVIDNRLAANRLAANRLAANRLAANRLAANRLAANRLAANLADADELLATPEGREVMAYIVSCALNEGTTLVAETASGTFEFLGELGLAADWEHHPLSEQGTGWVSACLFARVNANNVAVPVSLRGRHALLKKVDAAEASGWSLEEGAFYGNFFIDRAAGDPPDWHACRGRDQTAGETGGLISRDCTEPDPANPGLTICGFTDAGDCGDYDQARNATACDQLARAHAIGNERVKGGYYEDCYAEPRLDKKNNDPAGVEYREVITAYVLP